MRTFEVMAWALALVLIGIGLLGNPFEWYREIVWFDEAVHASVAFALGLAVAARLSRSVFRRVAGHAVTKTVLIASVVLALGALWEVAEWTIDQLRGTNMSRGERDTMVDLICDTAGALAGAAVGLWTATSLRPPTRRRPPAHRTGPAEHPA